MHILLVDDHPQIRGGTAMTLRALFADVRITEAESMAAARTALRHAEPIDLVLLDLSLADSDGIETLRTFRAACEMEGRFPRIVAVSGSEDAALIESVLTEHGTGFIPKGVPGEIFQKLARRGRGQAGAGAASGRPPDRNGTDGRVVLRAGADL